MGDLGGYSSEAIASELLYRQQFHSCQNAPRTGGDACLLHILDGGNLDGGNLDGGNLDGGNAIAKSMGATDVLELEGFAGIYPEQKSYSQTDKYRKDARVFSIEVACVPINCPQQ